MKDDLEKDLRKEIKKSAWWAKMNLTCTHIVYFVSIVASFSASILAAKSGDNPNFATYAAVFSALSGAALTISSTFRFDERSRWFENRNKLLQGYYRKLRDDETCDAVALSLEYSEKMKELEKGWPGFGNIKQ